MSIIVYCCNQSGFIATYIKNSQIVDNISTLESLPEFGEWLFEEVLKYVPHRQWAFSIPKRLRVYFMTNRRMLSKLSRCAWKVLSTYLKAGMRYDDSAPGGVIAVQTFGDFQNFNPHLHIIATDGCF